MNIENKNIDNLFREKLEGHSVAPPPGTWDNIRASLKNKKRRRAIILLRQVAAAAVIIIAVLSAVIINRQQNNENQLAEDKVEQVKTREGRQKNDKETITGKKDIIQATDNIETNETIANAEDIKAEDETRAEIAGHTPSTHLISEINKRGNTTYTVLSKIKAFIKPEIKHNGLKQINLKNEDNKPTLSGYDRELIAMNMKNAGAPRNIENSWEVGVRVSPGYSSHTSSHSESYRKSMTFSDTEGSADINGGISVEYKASGRWVVESGVYYSRNGQQAGNSLKSANNAYNVCYNDAAALSAAEYFNTPVQVQDGVMQMNSTAGIIKFTNIPKNAELTSNIESDDNRSFITYNSSNFSQVFDFIEIPVLLKYRVIDKKIKIGLVGGFSANLLIGNNAYIGEGSSREYIGQTADISTLNYSGTLGFEADYAIGKNLSVSVEPRMNYFLNSINKTDEVNYQPYRIGIYTSINYNF